MINNIKENLSLELIGARGVHYVIIQSEEGRTIKRAIKQ